MRLTTHTDYALRVLLYLGERQASCSIAEVAGAYRISENHLMKVVHALGRAGYLETTRGRGGGIRLGPPADQIRVGHVVRDLEGEPALADCSACRIGRGCRLSGVFAEASRAFLDVLDGYTLADLLSAPNGLAVLRRSAPA
jgi:Rrf2 family nitric oxide-sensitive transcriptional repressor